MLQVITQLSIKKTSGNRRERQGTNDGINSITVMSLFLSDFLLPWSAKGKMAAPYSIGKKGGKREMFKKVRVHSHLAVCDLLAIV